MENFVSLLNNYSLGEILVIIIALSLAIKGFLSFFDWTTDRVKKVVYKSEEPLKLKKDLKEQEQEIQELKLSIDEINKLIHLLIASDKDAIKAFITREHHYFVYQKGWIDDYSLDCVEQRYHHYEDQGGNSYIKTLMAELRALPKQQDSDSEN